MHLILSFGANGNVLTHFYWCDLLIFSFRKLIQQHSVLADEALGVEKNLSWSNKMENCIKRLWRTEKLHRLCESTFKQSLLLTGHGEEFKGCRKGVWQADEHTRTGAATNAAERSCGQQLLGPFSVLDDLITFNCAVIILLPVLGENASMFALLQ